jgi:hypothetical protein
MSDYSRGDSRLGCPAVAEPGAQQDEAWIACCNAPVMEF